MIDKVGQFSVFVHRFTGDAVGPGDCPRAAAEDTNFANLKTF